MSLMSNILTFPAQPVRQPLRRDLEGDPAKRERLAQIFTETRDAAYRIIDSKGSTSYGIGMGLARITAAVIQNQDVALPVSAYLQGEYGVEDLYIGTAAIINRSGIVRAIELQLNEHEKERFDASAKTLNDIKEEFFG